MQVQFRLGHLPRPRRGAHSVSRNPSLDIRGILLRERGDGYTRGKGRVGEGRNAMGRKGRGWTTAPLRKFLDPT